MTSQITESGLFDELAPDGPYAKELLVISATAAGLRYVTLGEDGENVVFLGHPDQDFVIAALRSIEFDWGNDPDAVSTGDFEYTYGRLLTACPDHQRTNEECLYCQAVSPGNWWLDWTDGNKHAGEPQYMPITVWSVER